MRISLLLVLVWCARAIAEPCAGKEITLVDQAGRPIVDALAFAKGDLHMYGLGGTDARGRFCVPNDEHGELEIWAPDAIGGWCAGMLTVPAGWRPKRVTMPLTIIPHARVHGRVLTQAGAPVAGADVEVAGITAGGCGLMNVIGGATTAKDGTFSIEGFAGVYTLLVRAEGYAMRDVAIPGGAQITDIVIDRGASWRGRVLAPDGSIVRGARMSFGRINRERVTIEVKDGAFAATNLTPEKYTMKIEVDDHPVLGTRIEWRDIQIKDGEARNEDISFSSGLDLAGVAKQPRGCVVAAPAKYNRNGIFDMRVRVKPDADGHFLFHHLSPGDWVISNCIEYPKVIADAGRTDVEVP